MPNRLVIYPYNIQSTSAIQLADTLGIKRVRQNGKYRWKIGDKIINWGNSRIANWMNPVALAEVWNKPSSISQASNKTETLQKLSSANIPIPDFVIQQHLATLMLTQGPKYPGLKHAVLSRTLTRANSGRGIVWAETPEQLVPAPLYTRYVPKTEEYRVHVFKEFGVIDVQQKKKDSTTPDEQRNKYIRNHSAGWVFCREDIHAPQVVLTNAIDSIACLGLDFGAVDIGFHPTIGPIVYEVNTAPGLEGQTLVSYATAFKRLFV